ncbi:Predicted alpha/beta hydrolase [Phaffia rhodozyma]|uniref:Predicted alpha/beta hydrolase n=1 Tax=Phaffia rhodozyma TaxID=264483 RepID=A0A0F7SKN5_PHARH|nr:Predicted alpha/beta hydrolase [Phaffia rhodozyma]
MFKPVHLLVLVHGLWGNGSHLGSMKEEIIASYEETHKESPTELVLLLPQSNEGDLTYDGIDICASRMIEEVDAEIDRLENIEGKEVSSFSIVGYSLGGLVARYMIGLLESRPERFFEKRKPMNFATFATPWIGMPRYRGVVNKFTSAIGSKLLSRTGAQLYCVDKEKLVYRLGKKGDVFYRALERFERIDVVANAVFDKTVPYPTGAISAEDPFDEYDTNGLEIEMESDRPVIKSFRFPSTSRLSSGSSSEESFDSPSPTPPPPPVPKRTHKRNSLPPWFRFRFPLNILFFVSLPLLVPVFVCVVLGHFIKSGRQSSRRLKNQTTLGVWDRLRSIEKAVEHDLSLGVDEAMSYELESSVPVSKFMLEHGHKKQSLILTEEQLDNIRSLNKLPKLKKHLVFFPDAFNSHAMIISRDPKKFPDHGRGRIVIRSWADLLVI